MLIDLTIPVEDGMKGLGTFPPISIDEFFSHDGSRSRYLEPCTGCQVEKISMVTHVGTHADAPLHFIRGGADMAEFPLEHYMGTAYYLDLADRPQDKAVDAALLKQKFEEAEIHSGKGKILLLRLSKKKWSDEGFEKSLALTQDAARLVVDYGFNCIGIDSMCVDCLSDMRRIAHMELLGAGVGIVEGLKDLDRIPGRDCWFCALPLRLSNAGGSPVRAICVVEEPCK